MSFIAVNRYDADGRLLEPTEREPKVEKFYVRGPVDEPQCDCGCRRANVYSLLQRRQGYWERLRRFCKECFDRTVREPMSGYRRKVKLGQGYTDAPDVVLVAWQGTELPGWCKLKRFVSPRSKAAPKSRRERRAGLILCCRCKQRHCICDDGGHSDLDREPIQFQPKQEKQQFHYFCQDCGFKTNSGAEAAKHERENRTVEGRAHCCPPAV